MLLFRLASLVMAALAISPASPYLSAQTTEPERRLQTITTFALSPYVGQLHINPFTLRPQNYARPGYSSVELSFVPVQSSVGLVEAAFEDTDRDRFNIIFRLPSHPPGNTFIETQKNFSTKDVILPAGAYALAEVRFKLSESAEDDTTLSYCMSEATIAFDVLGGDMMFMGALEIAYPPESEQDRMTHQPVSVIPSLSKALSGWRKTSHDLRTFIVREANFQPESSLCAKHSYQVSALKF